MAQFIIDKTFDPIILLKVKGKLELNRFSELSAEFDQKIAAKQHYAAIFDLRHAKGANDPRIGKFWTDWGRPIKHDVAEYCIGTSTVIKSILLKNIAKAVIRFIAPPHPTSMQNSIPEAISDVQKWARKKGADVPNVDLSVWEAL